MMKVSSMKKPKKALPGEQRHPSGGQSADEPKDIYIWTVDDRGSFRRGAGHPRLIYLHTLLRWAVNGTYVLEHVKDTEQIIRNNDSALASVQSLLADGIETGSVAVFNVHTRLEIGRAEKESLVSHLRTMDVKSSVKSFVGDEGLNYFLDGEKLCHFLAEKFIPTNDDFDNGALWQNLKREVPSEWLSACKYHAISRG